MENMTIGGRPLIWKTGTPDQPVSGQPARRDEGQAQQGGQRVLSGSVGERNSPAVIAQGAAPSASPAAPAAPAAGPLGQYTQATRYGDMLFVSGQIALDPRTGNFTTDTTVEGQTRQVMENVRNVLEANRLTMANVVAVTMYLQNINNLVIADRVYNTYFKGALPARSVVEAGRLPREALIEISVVAGR